MGAKEKGDTFPLLLLYILAAKIYVEAKRRDAVESALDRGQDNKKKIKKEKICSRTLQKTF